MTGRLTRITLAVSLAAIGSLALVSSAIADFHLTKIRQIKGEGGASADSSYIELQMYAPGQNLVSGHNITIWDQDGLLLGIPQPIATLPLSGPNPPFADNQRTILIGDTAVAGRDFTLDLSTYLSTMSGGAPPPIFQAGAACFETVDCVSWGAFTGANNLPDKTTPNGSVLPATYSFQRKIGAGCPTLLEDIDDTNNAQADFLAPGPFEGRPNSVAPTEVPCTGTGGGGGGGGGGFTTCAGKLTTIVGTDGKDALSGTRAADVIATGKGTDVVKGLAGNDTVCGGGGKDKLLGGAGKDKLLGEAGKDTLKGGPGKDKLKGGAGKDLQVQ
jgi:RTX calcium-binding nonapeptide repeat (4 copies)